MDEEFPDFSTTV